MMAWGTRKADEMSLEAWLDATEHGVPLYKKHGFEVVLENPLRPAKANPGPVWVKTEALLQPMVFWPMKRPVSA
jgi:hypothetical protein